MLATSQPPRIVRVKPLEFLKNGSSQMNDE